MTTELSPDASPALVTWAQALPHVLGLLDAHRRDLFRHELQRFLATTRFDPTGAQASAPALREMLLQAARAARQPAAIHATRSVEAVAELASLCEGLLATWMDALQSAPDERNQRCDPQGMRGEVFFGPRLGGKGRPGAKNSEASSAGETEPGESP